MQGKGDFGLFVSLMHKYATSFFQEIKTFSTQVQPV